jgi:hypothetical protein
VSDYAAFLAGRSQRAAGSGFAPTYMPASLMPFQEHLVDWSVRIGRGALFADCGLGKTLMALSWQENVIRHTNMPTLNLAPLAVTQQTAREAEKFGIEAHVSRDGTLRSGVNITNYERLHYFDPSDFGGVVCDESSILKSFDGERRAQITEFMRKVRFRLLCTATAAPNEYTELGASSEALGYLGHMDMLTRFFKNNQGNSINPMIIRRKGLNYTQLDDNAKWRFKGHAEVPFWKWVCSWARATRRPSDLGFDDGGFVLPPLVENQHSVDARTLPQGKLFALPAVGLSEQREERRRTIAERCEAAAQLVLHTTKPAIVWCHLNDEGDLLERLLPDCVQVSGKDDDDEKERKFMAFLDGSARVLVTKGRIGGWGLNFQHCAHCVGFPTHSYEEYYQEIRRCWRYGQKSPVTVDIVSTEGEKNVLANLQRKAAAADRMFSGLVAHMNEAEHIDRSREFTKEEGIPIWL